jgi:hypothetical protein
MYEHHLKDQIKALVKAKLLNESDEEKALTVLKKYWENMIAVSWSVDDVISRKRMSKTKARDILARMLHHHDAGIGINWDVIDANL